MAIVQFASSGAGSQEFYDLYRQLPIFYTHALDNSVYSKQIKDFQNYFISKECLKCNFVCRAEHKVPESCDNCLTNLENVEVINYNKQKEPKYPIGTRFKTRGKSPKRCEVVDILKTYNSQNELVCIRYVATHDFLGQTIYDRGVVETTITMGLIPSDK